MDWEGMVVLLAGLALRAVVVLLLLWVVLKLSSRLREVVVGRLEAKGFDRTIARFLGNMLHYGIMLMAILSCLGAFGIETTSFAAVIGGSALAIGLAFQGTLSNVAAGVMLVILRPFRAGDFIRGAGETGTVEEIGLLATILNTPDNKRIIVPNGKLFNDTIENVSFHPRRRVEVVVGVDYGANIDQTREVLLQAAGSVEGVLGDPSPAPVAVLAELADSALTWKVRVWATRETYWGVHEKLTQAIKQHLDAAGIGIPFPQMDVHLDRADA